MHWRRGHCFILFFTQNALLLLGVWTQAFAAHDCKQQYKAAGETIVLSPGPIGETLQKASWKFNETKIVDKEISGEISGHQFSGRVSLNQGDYSLTIQKPTITDSGDFTFVSLGAKGQRPTSCNRIIIQEVLSQPPTLNVINNTKTSNESCDVRVECTSGYEDVSYSWIVNTASIPNSSTLWHHLKPHERETTFTCTVSNMVSHVTVSKIINCETSPTLTKKGIKEFLIIMVGVSAGVLILIVVALVISCQCKKPKTSGNDDMTVYAEIDEIPSSKIMKPCSVYETLETRTTTVKPKAQTVYDQIQFNRLQPQNR